MPNGLLPDAPIGRGTGEKLQAINGMVKKTLPRVATGVGITHQTAKIHALGVWVYFVKAGFSHIRWRFFRILPGFVPPTQVVSALKPIPSANLGGKFTIGCCRRQEGWHILRCGRSGWMDQGSWWSYIFCGAAVFCIRSAPIHDVDDDSICDAQSRFLCLVALCCGCGCGLLWLCLYMHILYLIYTWFVWWFLLWVPSSLLSWSVLVTWRTCKNFGCQSSCLVWLN